MAHKLGERTDGMMTVEVSFIVPMISCIIVGFIFVLLFFLDISVAKSEAMRIADETAAAWKTDGDLVTGDYEPKELLSRSIYFLTKNNRADLVSEAESRMSERINTRLSVMKLSESNVSIQSKMVKATVSLSFRWPLSWMEQLMGDSLSFSCEAKAPVDNWQDMLRMKEVLPW
ncbi:MAG: hypothetical protein LUF92_06910 [Clostridiales bacterium]|nr:hypothetical protein [Clostridiales bacterium]